MCKLNSFTHVIIHVCTNNIPLRTSKVATILSDYTNLVSQIRRINPAIKIYYSSSLPRPVNDDRLVDGISIKDKIRTVNFQVRKILCPDLKITYLKSNSPFLYCGNIKRHLFATKDGGLH